MYFIAFKIVTRKKEQNKDKYIIRKLHKCLKISGKMQQKKIKIMYKAWLQ